MGPAREYWTRGLESLALAKAVLAAMAMSGIVAVIVASVVMRRFAEAPLHITEDLVGLMLSTALFLGLPYATLHSRHVRVAVVVEAAGRRFAPPLTAAAMLVGSLFFGWILIESLPWLEFAWERGIRTETSRVLLYPWMSVLTLSVGLAWLICVSRLFGILGAGSLPPPEGAPPALGSEKRD